MTVDKWISSFAARIGAEPPSREQIEEILALAAVAAHASERLAAPIACWVAGRSDRPLAELREAAERVDPEAAEQVNAKTAERGDSQ